MQLEGEKAELHRINSQNSRQNTSIIFAICGIFVAVFGFFYSYYGADSLFKFLEKNVMMLSGVGAAVYGIFAYLSAARKIADVDFLRRASRRSRLAPQEAWPFPGEIPKEKIIDFSGKIEEISTSLQQQAETYDAKASALLDKGVVFAGGGIIFFLASIFGWQIYIAYSKEFQTAHIYGIVSCGSLFVAVELISAWFLKQYRNFIDSATELLKIKAIFDKFILLKLASDDSSSSEVLEAQLGTALARDFCWPERYSAVSKGNFDIKVLGEVASMVQKILKDSKGG